MTLRKSICAFLNILLVPVLIAIASLDVQASYEISGIDFNQSKNGFQVSVKGETPPTYTVYELFEPIRVVIDIADASFASSVTLPYSVNQGPVAKITGKVLAEKEPAIAKLEIFLNDDRSYSVNRNGNTIQVVFATERERGVREKTAASKGATTGQRESVSNPPETGAQASSEMMAEAAVNDSVTPEARPSKKDLVADLLQSIATTPDGNIEKQFKRAGIEQDQFASAGFNKQKISVDFYKIDLHNVFRLFGEISGTNMIIDQGVGGTLTLALNEVPWDFAMDIILNLKGLQKEERYNTIVISPQSKQFIWPDEPEKELEIKAPPADVKIAIEQRLDMPAGMLEAKKLMFRAQKLEKENNFNGALSLYEQASIKWPENGELARRIASICLVDLGMNAKALHYAKAALKVNEQDEEAALQAAIAAANMRKSEAGEFFKRAVRSKRPSQEALVSYASYAEQNGDLPAALASLARQTDIYGDSLESMVARARIYDRDGQKEKADAEYRTILYSGYELDADLGRYIKGRLAAE